jgi:hypothetical protein
LTKAAAETLKAIDPARLDRRGHPTAATRAGHDEWADATKRRCQMSAVIDEAWLASKPSPIGVVTSAGR